MNPPAPREDQIPSVPAFMKQFEFDAISVEPFGDLRGRDPGAQQIFTVQKSDITPDQNRILESLLEVKELRMLSCVPDVDGVAYKMKLYLKQTVVHHIFTHDGYCAEAKTLSAVKYVQTYALATLYQSFFTVK